MSIQIQVKGLDQLMKKLDKLQSELEDTIQAAGEESGKMLLAEEGLQKYPPATSANKPPAPYYERGLGTWVTDEINLGNSERLGTLWVIDRVGRLSTRIGNSASYAPFVHGAEQAWFHVVHGWRELLGVAQEKEGEIQRIYQTWIDRLIDKTMD